MSPASVTVSEVIEAVRQRRALMAPETAGYLVLAAADQLTRAPLRVDAQHCTVAVDGGRVAVDRHAPPASPVDAERALRGMLHRLLAAASGGAPALLAVASVPARGSVSALVTELESALIPVNRAAAGRALSRLARETTRAQESRSALAAGSILADDDSGDDVEVEAEEHDTDPIELPAVDDLLAAVTPLPPPIQLPPVPDLDPPGALAGRWGPRGASAAPHLAPFPTSPSRGVDELLEGFMAVDPKHEARLAEDLRHLAGVEELALSLGRDAPFETVAAGELNQRTPPPHRATTSDPHPTKGAREPELATRGEPAYVAPGGARTREVAPRKARARLRPALLLALLLVIAGAAALFLWFNEPGFLSRGDRELLDAQRRLADAVHGALADRQTCRATVVVADVPAGAEVLVGGGQAPVDVEHVPAAARLEFVALADGYAPRRGTIPAGTAWDTANGKPRFELAIQLERSRAKPATLDPWPAATPGTTVGGQGAPGTVHVVTSPRGAEVWMVAGGSPEARIEALPCGGAIELLVAGATAGQPYRRRLHVDSGQTTPSAAASSIVARVSAGN